MYPVYFLVRLFFDLYYFCVGRLFNIGSRKIYIFTDSRGYRVDRWYCKKNPFLSYVSGLLMHNNARYSICRYKHTTLIDFLYDWKNANDDGVEYIILHAGVVDFSPRSYSQALSILRKKSSRIAALFGESALDDFKPCRYSVNYDGEETASLYSIDVLKKYIIPAINSLKPNVVWIGVCPVLNDWLGNYAKRRPENINVILDYQASVNSDFSGCLVDISSWSANEIMNHTIDNIHLTSDGNRFVLNALNSRLNANGETG